MCSFFKGVKHRDVKCVQLHISLYFYVAVCPLVIYCCDLESMISALKRSLTATRKGACRLWHHIRSLMPGHLSMTWLCCASMSQWHSSQISCQSVCPMMTPTSWVILRMLLAGAACMRVSVDVNYLHPLLCSQWISRWLCLSCFSELNVWFTFQLTVKREIWWK